jgi:hypothetical protein
MSFQYAEGQKQDGCIVQTILDAASRHEIATQMQVACQQRIRVLLNFELSKKLDTAMKIFSSVNSIPVSEQYMECLLQSFSAEGAAYLLSQERVPLHMRSMTHETFPIPDVMHRIAKLPPRRTLTCSPYDVRSIAIAGVRWGFLAALSKIQKPLNGAQIVAPNATMHPHDPREEGNFGSNCAV